MIQKYPSRHSGARKSIVATLPNVAANRGDQVMEAYSFYLLLLVFDIYHIR